MDKNIQNLGQLEESKGFKLLHVNVRSLTKKNDQLRAMFLNTSLDVITLSETWLNNFVSSANVALEGYSAFRQDRNLSLVKKEKGRRPAYIYTIRPC